MRLLDNKSQSKRPQAKLKQSKEHEQGIFEHIHTQLFYNDLQMAEPDTLVKQRMSPMKLYTGNKSIKNEESWNFNRSNMPLLP